MTKDGTKSFGHFDAVAIARIPPEPTPRISKLIFYICKDAISLFKANSVFVSPLPNPLLSGKFHLQAPDVCVFLSGVENLGEGFLSVGVSVLKKFQCRATEEVLRRGVIGEVLKKKHTQK